MCERFIVFNVSWYCKNRKRRRRIHLFFHTIFISYLYQHMRYHEYSPSTSNTSKCLRFVFTIRILFNNVKIQGFSPDFLSIKIFRLSFQHCFLIARFSMNLYFPFFYALYKHFFQLNEFLYRLSCKEIMERTTKWSLTVLWRKKAIY